MRKQRIGCISALNNGTTLTDVGIILLRDCRNKNLFGLVFTRLNLIFCLKVKYDQKKGFSLAAKD